MRLLELIILSVMLSLFASIFTDLIQQFIHIDRKVKELKTKNDSLVFISESFYKTCRGEGFSSLDEWKEQCSELWKLDNIEWKMQEINGERRLCGKWKVEDDFVEVYSKVLNAQKAGENESKNECNKKE